MEKIFLGIDDAPAGVASAFAVDQPGFFAPSTPMDQPLLPTIFSDSKDFVAVPTLAPIGPKRRLFADSPLRPSQLELAYGATPETQSQLLLFSSEHPDWSEHKMLPLLGKENVQENMRIERDTSKTRKSLGPKAPGFATMTVTAPTFTPKGVPVFKGEETEEPDGEETDVAEQSMVLQARQISRQKQIQYGYNTLGYQIYMATIPRNQRTRDMPRTPDKHQVCSKRSWDGQVRKWRRSLHRWDPEDLKVEWENKQGLTKQEDEEAEDMVDKLLDEATPNVEL